MSVDQWAVTALISSFRNAAGLLKEVAAALVWDCFKTHRALNRGLPRCHLLASVLFPAVRPGSNPKRRLNWRTR
jgi:hypothetical protein